MPLKGYDAMFGKKKEHNKNTVPPDEILQAVPYENSSVRTEHCEDGTIIWAPIRQRWYMKPPLSWLFQFRSEKGFGLDSLGSEVWEQCNGRRTVEQIIDEFAENHRVEFHEARLVVMHFMRMLMTRELIALAGHKKETS